MIDWLICKGVICEHNFFNKNALNYHFISTFGIHGYGSSNRSVNNS